jgi:hypothetical protein
MDITSLPTHAYVIIATIFAAVVLIGVLAYSAGKSAKTTKTLSIADVEDGAIQEIAKHFWSQDVSHKTFGEYCEEIREEAWKDKARIEKKLLRKNIKK